VKSVRLSGKDPGGCVTSSRNVVDAGVTVAEGVPVSVISAFCVTGALPLAVTVTVTLWPGDKTAGEMLAVVPGGRPLTDGVTSKSALAGKMEVPYWMEFDPPMETPSSAESTCTNEKLGIREGLTVSAMVADAVALPAAPVSGMASVPAAREEAA